MNIGATAWALVGATLLAPACASAPPASSKPAVVAVAESSAASPPPRSAVDALKWTVRHLPQAGEVELLAVAGEVVWLAGSEVLVVSQDGGRMFREVPLDLQAHFATHPSVGSDFDDGQVRGVWARGRSVYLMTGYQLFAGRELGDRWERLAAPLLNEGTDMEMPSPLEAIWGTDDALYLVENGGRLTVSTNDGKSWSDMPVSDESHGAFLTLSGNADGPRFITTGFGHLLLRNPDDGSWQARTREQAGFSFGWAVAGQGSSALCVGRTDPERDAEPSLWRSSDGGHSWEAVLGVGPANALAAGVRRGDWSLASRYRLLRSLDDGRTWTADAWYAREDDAVARAALQAERMRVTSISRSSCGAFALGASDPREHQLDNYAMRRERFLLSSRCPKE